MKTIICLETYTPLTFDLDIYIWINSITIYLSVNCHLFSDVVLLDGSHESEYIF